MEIKTLSLSHYDELLNLLNQVFAHAYGHPMDFERELPSMWGLDEEHMGHHVGGFEDGKLVGVVGVYPLPGKVLDTDVLFATTGNVAVHWDYEGRGYMNRLFTAAMERLEEIGGDAGRLGGARQRYGRFGYEPAGSVYRFSLNDQNRTRFFTDFQEDITFRKIEQEDTAALQFCTALNQKKAFHFLRDSETAYQVMRNKISEPYLAEQGGRPVGYLCASKAAWDLNEVQALDTKTLSHLLCAWQKAQGHAVSFPIAPYLLEEANLFALACDSVQIVSPSRFKICHWEKLVDAFLRLKATYTDLPDGELTLQIEGYGSIRLYVHGKDVGCEQVKQGGIPVNRLQATSLLFGPLPPQIALPSAPAVVNAWLPLPLTWDTLDVC